MRLKYIIVRDTGCELPILFHEIIDHVAVAGNQKVLSAGFCSIWQDDIDDSFKVSVFGESKTLKATGWTSDGRDQSEDAAIIEHALNQ